MTTYKITFANVLDACTFADIAHVHTSDIYEKTVCLRNAKGSVSELSAHLVKDGFVGFSVEA